MKTHIRQGSQALDGSVPKTFLKYLLPSLIGLISMTSASVVDGIFIGNFVGVSALAAVNLIMPFTTLLFGIGLMVSIGGSVRGGKYLGEKDTDAASAIFSKTLIFVVAFGVLVIVLGFAFERSIFAGLGATRELFSIMREYYTIILPFLITQLISVVLYFFIRLDGFPNLAALALAIGAVVNIALDYFFIVVYGWGLTGAAWATGLSQTLPTVIMLCYFLRSGRSLRFGTRQKNWGEIFRAAYNGISEFISEVSGGIIALTLNWMMIQRIGVNGVAAITVINYLIFVGFIVYFAISDTSQVMISQNFGARNAKRIRSFLRMASLMVVLFSFVFVLSLLTVGEFFILLFIDVESGIETAILAKDILFYIWPVFLFAGFNMLISGYLTAMHLPFQSGLVSVLNSLLMPISFLLLFFSLISDISFVVALPVAEVFTLVFACIVVWRYQPDKILSTLRY